VKPSLFLLGKEKVDGDVIEIVSPTLDAGGVALHVGSRYRIFTVNLEGRFYVWEAVVVELEK
jgi:hypothetical protein